MWHGNKWKRKASLLLLMEIFKTFWIKCNITFFTRIYASFGIIDKTIIFFFDYQMGFIIIMKSGKIFWCFRGSGKISKLFQNCDTFKSTLEQSLLEIPTNQTLFVHAAKGASNGVGVLLLTATLLQKGNKGHHYFMLFIVPVFCFLYLFFLKTALFFKLL